LPIPRLPPVTNAIFLSLIKAMVAQATFLRLQFGHFESPEGRKQNSPGLQPWEAVSKGNRPERAAEGRALFPKKTSFERPLILNR